MRRDEILEEAEGMVDALSFWLFLFIESREVLDDEVETAFFEEFVDESLDAFTGCGGGLLVFGFGDIVVGELFEDFYDGDGDIDIFICELVNSPCGSVDGTCSRESRSMRLRAILRRTSSG